MLLPKNRLSPITAVILQKYLKKPLEHFYDIKYICLRIGKGSFPAMVMMPSEP